MSATVFGYVYIALFILALSVNAWLDAQPINVIQSIYSDLNILFVQKLLLISPKLRQIYEHTRENQLSSYLWAYIYVSHLLQILLIFTCLAACLVFKNLYRRRKLEANDRAKIALLFDQYTKEGLATFVWAFRSLRFFFFLILIFLSGALVLPRFSLEGYATEKLVYRAGDSFVAVTTGIFLVVLILKHLERHLIVLSDIYKNKRLT